jgi:hypothetical protein
MSEGEENSSLSRLGAFIFDGPKARLLSLSLVYLVLFIPIGLYPNQYYYATAINPLRNTIQDPTQDWRLLDYFHNSLFHLLLEIAPFAPSYRLFIGLHFLVIAMALIIGAIVLLRSGSSASGVKAVALLGLPATYVVLGWVGTPDVLSMGAILTVSLSQNPFALALACLVGVTNHTTLFMIPMLFAGASRIVTKSISTKEALIVLVAVTIGLVARFVVQGLIHDVHGDRFGFIHLRGLSWFARNFARHFPLVVFTTFGYLWPFVIFLFIRTPTRLRVLVGGYFLACLSLNFAVEDNTRVSSLLLCGVPFVLIQGIQARESHSDWLPWGRDILVASLLLGATAPKVMIWAGNVLMQSSLATVKLLFGSG